MKRISIVSYILLLTIPLFAQDVNENKVKFDISGFVKSFFKFAVLATLCESLGLRIRNGVYNKKGFGLIPRAIVCGFLGLTIKMSFVIFATGTPQFLAYIGFKKAVVAMAGSLSPLKLLVAFSISAAMNLIYAPVIMTLHKITDTHILNNGGTLKGFFKPIYFGEIMANMNWSVQWNFVFKKMISFFWIPAHTINFCYPHIIRFYLPLF